jgi:hypothetical protein
MSLIKLSLACFVAAVCLAGQAAAQSADFAAMVNQLPADANSVFLINGSALRDAPPAVMEKWKSSYAAANNASPLALPEGIRYAAMATEFDLQHMQPLQQAVVLALEQTVTADSIGRARKGVVDRIGDNDIVWIEDACVFVNSDKQVTVVSPLNRQSAARWLGNARSRNDSVLSPYLNEVASSFVNGQPQIVMAVDLSNFFAEAIVSRAVERSGMFEESSYEDITRILTSIRGVTIESELVYETCAISLDFGENIEELKPHAGEFIDKALAAAGAKLGDPADWKLETFDTRILLSGKLTPSIMQRIFSLNTLGGVAGEAALSLEDTSASEPAQPAGDAGAAAEPSRPSAKDRLAESRLKREIRANQRYFKQITDMLNDLSQGHATNTLNDDALWISNYVRALTAAPTRSVDPILTEHAKYVARSLENVVGTLHMTADRIVEQQIDNTVTAGGDIEVTAIPTRRYNFGGHIRHRYAPMYRRDLHVGSAQENFAIQDREISRANSTASSILGDVYARHEEVRQQLSQKYGVEF